MKLKLKRYGILMGVITLILVSILAIQVNAEEPTTGSITIIAHEQQNGDTTTNLPLEGVEYTIYKVDESCEDLNDAYYYVEEHQLEGVSKTTNKEGIAVFDNLELGRYFIITEYKDGFIGTNGYFLVDIPMTNPQGNGWDYNITVEPKIQTAFGNLELTKVDSMNNPIMGIEFKVQKLNNYNYWEDYIPYGSDGVLTVTTDQYGKIHLNNLPGSFEDSYYRLVEISAPDGYIINNNILGIIGLSVLDDGKIESGLDNVYGWLEKFFPYAHDGENLTSITYMNEKPNIEKKIKNGEGQFVDSISSNTTDKLTFKITTDVVLSMFGAKTYKITDELPRGIILDRDSIKVEGTTTDGSEIIPEDMYTLSQDGLEITFDTSKFFDIEYSSDNIIRNLNLKYNNIIITYEATMDKDNIVIGGDGNVNIATLEYTNNIGEFEFDGREIKYPYPEISTTTVSDTAEVHTGAVLLEKVEKGNVDTKLAGAKFKIATTKENAENGVFVQDETGADIEVTTGENGQATIEGLKYADDGSDTSYWLVETQAPSYVEDGITKYYNLLKAPVEVKVGKTSHQSAVQIENGKGFELPETGSIGLVIFLVAGISIMSVAYVLNKKQIKE